MWRLFRYHLVKSFPLYSFVFMKTSKSLGSTKVYNLEILKENKKIMSIGLAFDTNNKSEEVFEILLDSIKSNIKNNLFTPKKRKRFLKRR